MTTALETLNLNLFRWLLTNLHERLVLITRHFDSGVKLSRLLGNREPDRAHLLPQSAMGTNLAKLARQKHAVLGQTFAKLTINPV